MERGPRRRLGGWGFEDVRRPVPGPLRAWLVERLGESTPFPTLDRSRLEPRPPVTIPRLGTKISREFWDRFAHARGQGLPDLIRLRTGTVPALPDGVLRPSSDEEVEAVLAACSRDEIRVVPWGGGTSVTGGVNVIPENRPAVSLDLERLSGLEALDEDSHLARFGAGTKGPAIEKILAERGFTLGHFPQSFELSTLGGWIVTRSSGQESLGYGSIDGLVAGMDVIAPRGRLSLAALPASAAGPDLRELVLGSEGRLGVVTRASVRIRRRPETLEITGTLLPDWKTGLDAARELVQAEIGLGLLRLSDPTETEVALALGLRKDRPLGSVVRRYLSLRGVTENACLMLCGASGDDARVKRILADTGSILRRHGGVGLGRSPGRRWLADRFRHPYLRDSLLDEGFATDTLETAAPWSRLPELTRAVLDAIGSSLISENERVSVLSHVSHPYRDGASLYFTFFFRCPSDPQHAISRWATLKRTATSAILAASGTLSHHHGVGSWHAPWYEREVGRIGRELVGASASMLDPHRILNPHALLDLTDRLEL